MKKKYSSFSLLFSALLLSACTVSVEPPKRLNVQLSTCLSEVPGWEAFTRCEVTTEQPLQGCFVWVGEETRGWHTLVYDGSWKSSGGSAPSSSDIEMLSTASLFVSFQRLPCETLLPNTQCVDVENCLFSMHNGQRSSTNPNAVVFDQPSGCNIDVELSLDDYQCAATLVDDGGMPPAPSLDAQTSDALLVETDVGAADQGSPDAAQDAQVIPVDANVTPADANVPPVDAAGPVCGNGIIEDGEGCDDGNQVSEICTEPGVQWCDICAEDCQIRRSYVSECGDGIHQVNEECDQSSNNFHARICRNNCIIDRGGAGSSGFLGSSLALPLTVSVTLEPVGVESDEGPTRLDFDLWVFHPSHVDEEPVTNFDFAFSRYAPSVPSWMEGSVLNEDNPYHLELVFNAQSRPCADGHDLNDVRGMDILIGLVARSLPIDTNAAELPVDAVVTVADSGGDSFLNQVVRFTDERDFFVFAALNVCRDGTRHPYRFMRYPNVKTEFSSGQ